MAPGRPPSLEHPTWSAIRGHSGSSATGPSTACRQLDLTLKSLPALMELAHPRKLARTLEASMTVAGRRFQSGSVQSRSCGGRGRPIGTGLLAVESFPEGVRKLFARVGLAEHPDLAHGLAHRERHIAVC